jgi:hypothetical protein
MYDIAKKAKELQCWNEYESTTKHGDSILQYIEDEAKKGNMQIDYPSYTNTVYPDGITQTAVWSFLKHKGFNAERCCGIVRITL